MFDRQAASRVATTLLALAAMVGAGFGAEGLIHRACVGCFPASAVSDFGARSHCARQRRCCCGPSARPRTCGCHRQDETAVPPLSAPEDTGQTLKWLPGSGTPAALLAGVTSGLARPTRNRNFLSSLQHATQAFLCVWRI
jgi:hypothetical protein